MKQKLALLILLAIGGLSCSSQDIAAQFPTTTIQEETIQKASVSGIGFLSLNEINQLPTTTTTTTTSTVPPTVTTLATPTYTTTTEIPVPTTVALSNGFADPYDWSNWDKLAGCECGGNWACNTGNGYYGGLQFLLSSWQQAGGSGYPHEHSREEQIKRGIILWEQMGGWGPWPACSSKLGFR